MYMPSHTTMSPCGSITILTEDLNLQQCSHEHCEFLPFCKSSINMNSSLGLPVTEDRRALNPLSQRLPQIRAFLQERDQSVLKLVLERSVVKIQLWLAPENEDNQRPQIRNIRLFLC